MVAMRMGEEHMPDSLLLFGSAVETQATHIDRHRSIDEIAADVLASRGILH
jgi:hypothetical protein